MSKVKMGSNNIFLLLNNVFFIGNITGSMYYLLCSMNGLVATIYKKF